MSSFNDFEIKRGVLSKYKGTDPIVRIPYVATSIGQEAFRECMCVEKVIIPHDILTIGRRAFFNCKYLKEINISNGLISIGKSAFEGCQSLEKIVLPDSVTSLYHYTFADCDKTTIIINRSSIAPSFEVSLEWSRCSAIFAPNLRLSDFYSYILKSAASFGFIKNISQTENFSDRTVAEYCEYILKDEELLTAAYEHMLKDEKTALSLVKNNFIPLGLTDTFVEMSISRNTPAITTILMEYKNKIGTQNKNEFDLGTL